MDTSTTIIEIKNYLRQRNASDVSSIMLAVPVIRMAIPLAIERIPAGFPSPAQDYIDKNIDMNEYLIRNECSTFIVNVGSLSMLNAGIDIDDKLVVDRSLEAKHRDIVIAMIDNEFTVKRLMIDLDERWLKAENPEFSDIHLKDGQELIIWGVVTFILKSAR